MLAAPGELLASEVTYAAPPTSAARSWDSNHSPRVTASQGLDFSYRSAIARKISR